LSAGVCTLLALLAGGGISPQTPDAVPPTGAGAPETVEHTLDEIAREAVTATGAPGIILGIRTQDGSTSTVSTGLAEVAYRGPDNAPWATARPMEADAPFYWGSVSKMYTAYVVLRLAEEGVLSLNDRVSHFIRDFPRGDEITIRHLLAHASGLRDFYGYFYFRPDRQEMIAHVTGNWSTEELIAFAGRFGHRFDPGTDWDYSSTNYFLLGVVIERATGRRLAEAYEEYIFDPLGLSGTWMVDHESGPRHRLPTGYMGPVDAWPHSKLFGRFGPTTLLDRAPAEWGSSGLAGPIRDGLTFLGRLIEGELTDASTLGSMTVYRGTPPLGVPAADRREDEHGYGLGLVWTRRRGYDLVGHGGLFNGHTAGFWYIRQCRLTVGLYMNRGFTGQWPVLDRVLDALDQRRLSDCPVP